VLLLKTGCKINSLQGSGNTRLKKGCRFLIFVCGGHFHEIFRSSQKNPRLYFIKTYLFSLQCRRLLIEKGGCFKHKKRARIKKEKSRK
jgi:hypothetical protein